jgi:hypothetical protein
VLSSTRLLLFTHLLLCTHQRQPHPPTPTPTTPAALSRPRTTAYTHTPGPRDGARVAGRAAHTRARAGVRGRGGGRAARAAAEPRARGARGARAARDQAEELVQVGLGGGRGLGCVVDYVIYP